MVKPAASLTDPTTWKQSYYACEANGQVMAIYDISQSGTGSRASYKVTLGEQLVYGASRVGIIQQTTILINGSYTASPPLYQFGHEVGEYRYEITNHLGNVNAVITDNKVWNATGSYCDAEIMSKIDYYPFGMEMPGRKVINDNYRFAYNGMELDNEIRGTGNSYTTEFSQYDPRLGRWLSLDPLMGLAPGWTPYRAFFDNPIIFADPSGLYETKREARQARRGAKDAGYEVNDIYGKKETMFLMRLKTMRM